MDIFIDWGRGSQILQRGLGGGGSKPSFWLTVTPPPVVLGLLKEQDIAIWDTAPITPIALKSKTPTSVELSVAPGFTVARLDFELKATIGSVTRTVLAFKQLFYIDAHAQLIATRYSVEDFVFAKGQSGSAPVRKPGQSKIARRGRREYWGCHPLITLRILPEGPVMAINAEFVDATELWWAIRKDKWNWYLNQALGGRQENLRVLAWTGGGLPMIWFAVVPEAAQKTLDPAAGDAAGAKPGAFKPGAGSPSTKDQPAADIVFFRPPPGINAFQYNPTADGFANTKHDSITLRTLARYLLSARPYQDLVNAQIKDDITLRVFADQIQPSKPKASPTDPTDPRDPMDIASDFRKAVFWINNEFPTAFRPAGLEDALNRAGPPHVLFLPLGADTNTDDGKRSIGYAVAVESGLKDKMASALTVLWNNGAIARDARTPPDSSQRQLWVTGHSAGNLRVWDCLKNNASDVDRVISISPTPKIGNLSVGLQSIIRGAVAARKKINNGLDFFLISAPDLTNTTAEEEAFKKNLKQPKITDKIHPLSLDEATDLALRQTGVTLTVIPEYDERASYWTLKPLSEMNPYMTHLLGLWKDDELKLSAEHWAKWNFLFFHEYPAYGGHIDVSVSPPSFRSFFLDALGPPKPRPAP